VLSLFFGSLGLATLGAFLFLVALVVIAPALVRPIAKVFGGLLTLVFVREGHIAQGNLVRQPGRAATTASAMMIGLAVVLGMAGLVTSVTDGVYSYIDESLGADYLFMPQSVMHGVYSYIDESLGADYLFMPQSVMLGGGNVGAGPEFMADILNTPGVEAATSLRMSPGRIGESDLQVVGIDPETYDGVSGLVFSSGDASAAYAGIAAGRALIANDLFAAQNNVEIGQELTLLTPEGQQVYHVVGIGTDYINQKGSTVYISQANLERDFHETADLVIMVNQSGDADTTEVRSRLETLASDYPALTFFSSAEWLEDLKEESSAKLASLYVVLGMLAAPSLIALVNTLGINVLERTREIGMLRAVGATRRQVRRTILAESLLLAGAGTGFGILSGIWLGYILVEAMNVLGYVAPYFFPLAGILTTIAVGLLFGVFGALLPARQAARMDIVRALAYE
jgi:putative ABC transport system permease protein